MHKGESLCCFRDSASVTYGGMLPSDLTLSALRFILYAKSGQSCKQDCETVDFCNSPPKEIENIHEDIEHISVDIGFYRDRVSALIARSANFDGAQGAHRVEHGEDGDAYVGEDRHPHGGYPEQG